MNGHCHNLVLKKNKERVAHSPCQVEHDRALTARLGMQGVKNTNLRQSHPETTKKGDKARQLLNFVQVQK